MSIEEPNTPSGGTLIPRELQSQAAQDLNAVTEKAKEDLGAITQQAADEVRELGHQAGAKVGEATEKAKSFAADQKDLAAGHINGVAAAITKVADELDGSEQQTVARYARDLAAGLSNIGKTIEDRDIDELMGLAQDFGHKQPIAFLGAAALAGFVASRFALASTHRRESKPAASAEFSGDQSNSYRPNDSLANGGSSGQSRTGGQ